MCSFRANAKQLHRCPFIIALLTKLRRAAPELPLYLQSQSLKFEVSSKTTKLQRPQSLLAPGRVKGTVHVLHAVHVYVSLYVQVQVQVLVLVLVPIKLPQSPVTSAPLILHCSRGMWRRDLSVPVSSCQTSSRQIHLLRLL